MLERSVANRMGLSKKLFVRLTAVILGSLVMMGCDVSRSWTEEVKLSDGSVIVVKRREVRERFGEIGHHGKVLRQEINYERPGGAIRWVGDIDPLIFDYSKDRAYVVAYLSTGEECGRYKGPPNRFLAYERVGETWRMVPMSSLPDSLEFNLLLNGWDSGGGLITFSLKRQQDVNPPDWFKKFDKNHRRPCPDYSRER